MDWQTIESAPLNKVVMTMISDDHGQRNEQPLIAMQRNPSTRVMWFFPDKSMYVYYTPTHWKPMDTQP